MSNEMEITDKFIEDLFDGTNFGAIINGNVAEMRKQLAKTLRDQVGGYWSGHTAYHIAVNGGFLIDAKSSAEKKLTALGRVFMENFENGENHE